MKSKLSISLIFKIIILVLAYAYVIFTLYNAPDLTGIFEVFKDFSFYKMLILALVVLLMIFNWSIEAIKWSYLLKPVYDLGFTASLKSVMSGTTSGLATPNRLGEFAGRVLHLPEKARPDASMLSIAGGFSQLFVTLLFGLIGFVSLLIYIPASRGIFVVNDLIIVVFSIIFLGIMLWLYSNTKALAHLVSKIPFLRKNISFNDSVLHISTSKKWMVLALSLFRYIIFLQQFYLLVYLFDLQITYLQTIQVVSCIYLLMAIIPVIAAGEPGVRGSVSILLFSLFATQPAAAFSASLMLWLINVVIPSIFGSLFLIKTKKYESS